MAVVALPIETKVRELDGKLWLACCLASAGHKVALGGLGSMKRGLEHVQPDVYIGVNALFEDEKVDRYARLHHHGVKILILDSEGGVFASDKAYEQRLSPTILALTDGMLCWGKRAEQILGNVSSEHSALRIAVVGNPSFDLLNDEFSGFYEKTSASLRAEYGNYILVNTNFTGANHFSPLIERAIHRKLNLSKNPEAQSYQSELFQLFIEGIMFLASEIPDARIVIRPHPSENHDTYRDLFSAYKTVEVKHQGDVRPWIMASACVIHNSCTTGIEAAWLRIPVFSYRPIASPRFDLPLPNAVSEIVTGPKELRRKVLDVLEDRTSSADNLSRLEPLKDFIHNTPPSQLAARNIVREVSQASQLAGDRAHLPAVGPQSELKRRLLRLLGERGVGLIRRCLGRQEGANYAKQKFSGLEASELTERIAKLQACGFPFGSISVTPVKKLPSVFWIADAGCKSSVPGDCAPTALP